MLAVALVAVVAAVLIVTLSGGKSHSGKDSRAVAAGGRNTTQAAAAYLGLGTSALRKRLRNALYCAALPASQRWNPQLIALYQRLRAAGKEHKRALIACARKLLIYANTVVARGTPWSAQPNAA